MTLDLISPIGANFLKDWPGQNAINSDRIDAFAGPCLTTHALQDYVPILTASVTNPTLGSGGTLVGKYYKIFDMIYTWGEFRFGTGASIGSGTYQISLPFPADTSLTNVTPFTTPISVGNGIVYDFAIDAERQPVIAMLGSPDYLIFATKAAVAGATTIFTTHNNPITWSGAGAPGGDGIMWSAKYKKVSS